MKKLVTGALFLMLLGNVFSVATKTSIAYSHADTTCVTFTGTPTDPNAGITYNPDGSVATVAEVQSGSVDITPVDVTILSTDSLPAITCLFSTTPDKVITAPVCNVYDINNNVLNSTPAVGSYPIRCSGGIFVDNYTAILHEGRLNVNAPQPVVVTPPTPTTPPDLNTTNTPDPTTAPVTPAPSTPKQPTSPKAPTIYVPGVGTVVDLIGQVPANAPKSAFVQIIPAAPVVKINLLKPVPVKISKNAAFTLQITNLLPSTAVSPLLITPTGASTFIPGALSNKKGTLSLNTMILTKSGMYRLLIRENNVNTPYIFVLNVK